MATLHDPEVKDDNDEEFDDLLDSQAKAADSTDTTPETKSEDTETETTEDEVPEKYKGKSSAEIIRMHQEAEKMAGKQSSEVGELRKLVDDFITGQVKDRTATEPAEEVDFFDDPKAAVAAAVANHPSIKAAEATTASVNQEQAVAALQARHPDMGKILASEAFGQWVIASPLRQRLYKSADSNFDLAAADELMEMFKERQALNTAVVATEEKERKRTVKQAATGATRGTARPKSKKIYRRVDIIKLMKDDPKRYEAMQDEIMAAYADKRVR